MEAEKVLIITPLFITAMLLPHGRLIGGREKKIHRFTVETEEEEESGKKRALNQANQSGEMRRVPCGTAPPDWPRFLSLTSILPAEYTGSKESAQYEDFSSRCPFILHRPFCTVSMNWRSLQDVVAIKKMDRHFYGLLPRETNVPINMH
ncbi:Myb/SANT-like DNA-binding domain-containing protein 1 [Clarias magur]|uniref:Myb/SANT-like DNA-binding domain-containing protein 1 n=1 Tax=Clarias magur TaxID=1594786 RepID=A0A8J4U7N7_CLAMG|nr:Myb/SANT-like DNA-binding domain-containing protein 1 [Clarias magur]